MTSLAKYDYIDIEDNPDFKSLRVKNIRSFIKMIQQFQVKIVFRIEKPCTEGKSCLEFLILVSQIMYRLDSAGYKTLEDYEEAVTRDFPDAEMYYDAIKTNIYSYKEYLECKKSGVVDKPLFVKAQKLGFIDAFEKFKERCITKRGLMPPNFHVEEYDTPIKLSEYATSKGFKDYGDFDKAFFQGFTDMITYEDAKKKGFTYGSDYVDAIKMGFDQIKEYQEAKHLKIQNKFEYNYYNNLRNNSKGIYSYDQVALVLALKNCDNGKKLSLKKLFELLTQKEEEIKFATKEDGTRDFPEWYAKKLKSEEDIKLFVSKESLVKSVGIFDSDGEYFEIWKISHQKIYIDGNNVAFANNRKKDNPDADDKPHCSNIKIVVDELLKRNFEEISVIADPGLKRRTADLPILSKMISEKQIIFHEAPNLTEADEFFIKKAKEDKAYIVSNDTFRDWRLKDTWIAENIDRIRVPFMIEGGKVTLSGIEKIN